MADLPPGATVRDAVEADLDQICSLIRELADYEHMSDQVVLDESAVRNHLFGREPAAKVLIAEAGSEVAGMALWFTTFSTFLGQPGIWLEDLFVRPEHRGKGLGLGLIQALRDRTGGRVEWQVLDWNQPSIEFYDRLGAKPLDGWITYRWDPADT
jgi:GNAT superfamily N-acetyltransferase